MLLNTNLSTAATTLTKWLVSIPSVAQTKGNSLITQSIYEGLSEFPYYKQHPQHLLQVPHLDGSKLSIVSLVRAIDDIQDTLVLLCNVDTNSPAHYGIFKNISTQSDELERQLNKLVGENHELRYKIDQHEAIFGLGVLESKCAAGCMLAALKELSDNHVRLNLNIILVCTTDNAHQYQGLKQCIPVIQDLCQKEHLTLRLTLNAQPQLNNPTFANSSALFNVAANTVAPRTNEEGDKNQDLTQDQDNLSQAKGADANALAGLASDKSKAADSEAAKKSLQESNQRMAAAALSKAGTPELCLYTGNYGKIEPSFYILGQSTSVNQPFTGFSASLIAAELIHEFELNPKILQKLHQKPLIPTFDSLKVKDFGKEFSPDGVQLSFNLPILPAVDLSDVLELMKEIAASAIESAAEVVDEREAILAKLNHQQFVPQIQDAEVISFSDLLERACANYAGDMRQAVNSLIRKCKKEGFNSHQSAITIIERLNDFAQLPRPSIVVYFTDNLLPSQSLNANNYQDRELFMLLDNLMHQFAEETQLNAHMATHYAPSEVGFLRPEGLENSTPLIEQESPLGFEHVPSLNVPTVTLGVLGGNLSQVSEYVESSMCRFLPQFVLQLVETLANNPLSQSKAMQPQDDLQRHLDELGQKAEEIAAAALSEIRAVDQQSKQGSGFYTQVSQGTLSPEQLNYKEFKKSKLNKASASAPSAAPSASEQSTTVSGTTADSLAKTDTTTVASLAAANATSAGEAGLAAATGSLAANPTVAESIEELRDQATPDASSASLENAHPLAAAPDAVAAVVDESAQLQTDQTKQQSVHPLQALYDADGLGSPVDPDDMPAEAIPEITKVVPVASNQEHQLLDQAQQRLRSAFGSFKKFISTGKEQLSKVKVPNLPNILPKTTPSKPTPKDKNIEPQLQLLQGEHAPAQQKPEPEIDQALVAASAIAIAVNGTKEQELNVGGFSATDNDDELNLEHKAMERLVADTDIVDSVPDTSVLKNFEQDLGEKQPSTMDGAEVATSAATKQAKAPAPQAADSLALADSSAIAVNATTAAPAESATEHVAEHSAEPIATSADQPNQALEQAAVTISESNDSTESAFAQSADTNAVNTAAAAETANETDTKETEANPPAAEKLVSNFALPDSYSFSTGAGTSYELGTDHSLKIGENINGFFADANHNLHFTDNVKPVRLEQSEHSKVTHTAHTTILMSDDENTSEQDKVMELTGKLNLQNYSEDATLSSNTRVVHSTEAHLEEATTQLPTQDTIITGTEPTHDQQSFEQSTTIISSHEQAFVPSEQSPEENAAEQPATIVSSDKEPAVVGAPEQSAAPASGARFTSAAAQGEQPVSHLAADTSHYLANISAVDIVELSTPVHLINSGSTSAESAKQTGTLSSSDSESGTSTLAATADNTSKSPEQELAKAANASGSVSLFNAGTETASASAQGTTLELDAAKAVTESAPTGASHNSHNEAASAQENAGSKADTTENAQNSASSAKSTAATDIGSATGANTGSVTGAATSEATAISAPAANNKEEKVEPVKSATTAKSGTAADGAKTEAEAVAEAATKTSIEASAAPKASIAKASQKSLSVKPTEVDPASAAVPAQDTAAANAQSASSSSDATKSSDQNNKESLAIPALMGMSDQTASIMQTLPNVSLQYPEYHNAQESMLQKQSLLKIESQDSSALSGMANHDLEQGFNSTYAQTSLEGLSLDKVDPAQAFAQLLVEIEEDDSAKNNFRTEKRINVKSSGRPVVKSKESATPNVNTTNGSHNAPAASVTSSVSATSAASAAPIAKELAMPSAGAAPAPELSHTTIRQTVAAQTTPDRADMQTAKRAQVYQGGDTAGISSQASSAPMATPLAASAASNTMQPTASPQKTLQPKQRYVPQDSNFYGDLMPTEQPVRTRSLAPSVMGGSATLRTMKSMPAATVKPSAGKIRSSQLAAKRGGVAGVPGLAGAAGVLGTGDGRSTISDLNQPQKQPVRRNAQAIGGLNKTLAATHNSVASTITSTLIESRQTGSAPAINGLENAISTSIRSSGGQGKSSPTPVNSQAKSNKGGLGPGVTQRRQPLKPDAGGNTKDYSSLTTAMSAARLRNTKIRTPLKLNEHGQAATDPQSRDERRAALHKAMYGGLDEEVAVVNPVLGLGNKQAANASLNLGKNLNRLEASIKASAPSASEETPQEPADANDSKKQKGSFIAFDKGDFLNYDPSALTASFKGHRAKETKSKAAASASTKNQK